MQEGNGDRLDGWKEIAAYLNRSVRSAQRWNQDLGLPVHRVQGRKGNIVYAFASEIDQWLASIELPTNGDTPPSEPDSSSGPFPRWIIGWALFSTVAAIAGWVILTVHVAGENSDPELNSPSQTSAELSSAEQSQSDGGIRNPSPSWNNDGSNFPLPRGLIVFTSNRDGNNEVYIVDDDGNNERRLTNHPGEDRDGVLAPDGSKIAFSSIREDGSHGVYVLPIDGGDPRRVFLAPEHRGGRIQGIDWSSDGDRILFGMRSGGTWNLFEINEDGSDQVQLTDSGNDSRLPSYGHDGQRILFTRNTSFNGYTQEVFELYAGDRVRQLTFTGHNAGAFEILMDGTPAVMFTKGMPTANSQLFIHSRGAGERPVYPENNTYQDATPAGPRGPGSGLMPNQIVFSSNRAGDKLMNIWRMSVDGANAFQITFEGGNFPRWWIPAPSE